MDRYFGGEEFSLPEILMALTANVARRQHGSGNFRRRRSVKRAQPTLLDDIVQYFPSPDKRKKESRY